MFRIEQTGHRFLHLVDQFVNNTVELHLNRLAFRDVHGHALDLDVETDDYRVRRAREQDVGFGNRSDAGMNNLEVDLLALDLTQRADQRFERTLRVAFQNDEQVFHAVGSFEQTFERSALRYAQLIRAPLEETFFAQGFRGALGFHHE